MTKADTIIARPTAHAETFYTATGTSSSSSPFVILIGEESSLHGNDNI